MKIEEKSRKSGPVKKLLDGTEQSYSLNTSVKIDPMNKGNIIETSGVAIRSNGIYAKNCNIDNMYARRI